MPAPPISPSTTMPSARANGRTEQAIMADMRAAVADIDEAMVFVIPPPVIQGIGSGGFRMMIQDRGAVGLWRDAGRGLRLHGPGRTDARPRQRLHPLQRLDPARLCRRRPDQGGHARRAAGARVRGAAGLSRLGLRQRLQPARPDLSGDRPGRFALPRRHRGHRPAQDPLGQLARWYRSARSRRSRTAPARTA